MLSKADNNLKTAISFLNQKYISSQIDIHTFAFPYRVQNKVKDSTEKLPTFYSKTRFNGDIN